MKKPPVEEPLDRCGVFFINDQKDLAKMMGIEPEFLQLVGVKLIFSVDNPDAIRKLARQKKRQFRDNPFDGAIVTCVKAKRGFGDIVEMAEERDD
jgi:predicted RNase H-like nuclease (RuvC/YqgF family)